MAGRSSVSETPRGRRLRAGFVASHGIAVVVPTDVCTYLATFRNEVETLEVTAKATLCPRLAAMGAKAVVAVANTRAKATAPMVNAMVHTHHTNEDGSKKNGGIHRGERLASRNYR
jgi:hypothetical protein